MNAICAPRGADPLAGRVVLAVEDRQQVALALEPLPHLAASDSAESAVRALAKKTPAVLVFDGKRPVGILTRIDVIGFGGSCLFILVILWLLWMMAGLGA